MKNISTRTLIALVAVATVVGWALLGFGRPLVSQVSAQAVDLENTSAPGKATVPTETSAPGKATVPTETLAPGKATVPTDTSAPGKGVVPIDPSAPGKGSNSGTFYISNPLDKKFKSVGALIDGFMEIFTYLAILAAVVMIIYVGLRLVLAQGDTKELQARKDQLLWILVGVGLIIGARLIVSAVINTLKETGAVNPNVIQSAERAIDRR